MNPLSYVSPRMFFLKKRAKLGLFLFIFVLFSHRMDKYSTNLTIVEKALMACLGVKPRAAGWKVQMNPLSYGGTPIAPATVARLTPAPQCCLHFMFACHRALGYIQCDQIGRFIGL